MLDCGLIPYHLLKRLFARVERLSVDLLVPLGLDEVELAVVPERSPLRVDDDVVGKILVVLLVGVQRLYRLDKQSGFYLLISLVRVKKDVIFKLFKKNF